MCQPAECKECDARRQEAEISNGEFVCCLSGAELTDELRSLAVAWRRHACKQRDQRNAERWYDSGGESKLANHDV